MHAKRTHSPLLLSVGLGLVLGTAACDPAPASTAHAAATDDDAATSTDTRTALRVQVSRARRGALDRGASTTGVVYADRTADVAAEVAGRVIERRVEPGAVVAERDVLVALDPVRVELAVSEAEATLRARRVDLAETRQALERGDNLLKRGALSQSQHDGLRFAVDRAHSAQALAEAALGRARRAFEDSMVRAPFAGVVESVFVDVGDYAQPGAPIARLTDFERVRVRAGLTAAEAADVAQGQKAIAEFADLGGERTEGRVQSVGRIADRSGTYTVEVWLDNPDPRLREGMVALLHLDAPTQTGSLLVPRSALLRRDDGLSVFVVEDQHGEPVAVARRVRVGRSGRLDAEIVEGLEEGQAVVTDGLFALRDGARVFIDESQVAVKPVAAGERDAAWND